ARDRTDVDDGTAAFDERRQQPVGDGDQGGDVGVDHLPPLRQVAGLRGRGAEREAGVVDQQVDVAKAFRDRVHRGGHGVGVADVEAGGVHAVAAEAFGQGV